MIGLISIIDSTRPVLFEHFLKHYSKLGIEYFYCCFHSESPQPSTQVYECLDLFKKYSRGKYILSLGEQYTSRLRMNKNRILEEKSREDSSSWRANVDSDEFYIFPGTAEEFLREIEPYNAVRAIMVDRLAEQGFPALQPDKSLFAQFPLNSFVTNDLLQATGSKVFFFRGNLKIGPGSHFLLDVNIKYYPEWLPCYHFKWDRSCMDRLRKRRDQFKKMNAVWWIECERFVQNSLARVSKKITLNLETGF